MKKFQNETLRTVETDTEREEQTTISVPILLQSDCYLSVIEVAQKLKLCRATIFNLAKKDATFPLQHKFGRSSRWLESEIIAWAEQAPRGAYGEGR
jgi:predicted DNA-binding transcriptional regulator AlpA